MYQRDDVKRRIIGTKGEKASEDVYSLGEIELIHMRSSLVKNGGMKNDPFAKVVENQTGKYLLADELRFFGMKSRKTNGIFEIAERSFNAPAKVVNPYELIGRERNRIEIREQIFKHTGGDFHADNSERNRIIERVVKITEIKPDFFRKNMVLTAVLLYEIRLFFRKKVGESKRSPQILCKPPKQCRIEILQWRF